MGKEIERKFLVRDSSFIGMAIESVRLVQGYLSREPRSTVRVRVAGSRAFITVKGLNDGAVRDEWEYPIPVGDALDMLSRCCDSCALIDKTRYIVPYDGLRWEVDVFAGRLSGLVVAEVELDSPDRPVRVPSFVGREVTGDPRYYNSSLADASSPVPPAV